MFKTFRFAVLIAGVTLGFAAMAQPAPDDQAPPPGQGGDQSDQADPPSRVARLSYIKGAVSFVPAGENDWVEAQMNRPLITGDKLWTDNGSRAELEIGSAAVRMDQQSSFDFLNLDDNTAQMELTQGTLNLRVRRLYDGQTYEIDTPTLAFVVNRVGEFRVDVQPDGQTTIVSVMHGGGDVYGEGGARFHVDEGQSVSFNDPQLQNYQSADLPQPDAFDQFALQRDGRWDNAPSKRYVAEETIGYQDLDDYGTWSPDVPEYGNVWYPSQVDVDWSPYHNGHWAWVGAYGWSWVDDAPWGFAPFHYGRWAYIGNRWGWCPGEIGVRPIYAPALVAFVGGGVAIGISSGPIGWFPLGYHDVYFPAYHVSRGYFTNINVRGGGVNVTVVNNYYGGYARGNINYGEIHYANRGIRGAVVAVPAAAFVGARPVRGAAIHVDEHTFGNGGRVSGFAAVAPTRASLVSAPAARAIPAAAIRNRQIVAATKPPAPVASFATRQAVLSKNPGQPLPTRALHTTSVAAGGAAAINRGGATGNVRVVTQTGTPLRTAAPTIKTGAVVGKPVGNPRITGNSSLPAVQRGTVNGTQGRPAVTTGGAQAQHFDSSRFAHPGAAAGAANATTNNGKAQTIHPTTSTLPSRATTNNNLKSTTTNGQTETLRSTNTGRTPRTTTSHVTEGNPQFRGTTNNGQAQTIRPTNTIQNSRATTNGQTQTVHPTNTIQNSTLQNNNSRGTQNEYRHTTTTPQTNTYHPTTSQPAQTYHAPVQQQIQPRAVTPHTPPPPPPRGGNNNDRGGNKDKDDDKKHGH